MSKNVFPSLRGVRDERTDVEKLRDWCANVMKWSKYVIFDTNKGVIIKEGRYESK